MIGNKMKGRMYKPFLILKSRRSINILYFVVKICSIITYPPIHHPYLHLHGCGIDSLHETEYVIGLALTCKIHKGRTYECELDMEEE